MKIGLIDVDGKSYPNIALMKLSAWHKKNGDQVDWYDPLFGGHYDKVYMSKVFSFSPDYEYYVDADEVIKGGSGYCITLVDGKEVYDKSKDADLPPEVEHIYPDYSLYPELTKNRAFGYLSRGCPRKCDFCHVKTKEGTVSYKVADLAEFWAGQKYIDIMDPNLLACKDWKDLLDQLEKSGARVNFNQGLDIRLMTKEKADAISRIKTEKIHFAWDRYQDKAMILPKFEMFRRTSNIRDSDLIVFVLTGFDTTLDQDLERIYTLRDMTGFRKGFTPYVMVYDKEHKPKGHYTRRLQRWCNNKIVFHSVDDFNDYDGSK